MSDNIPPEIIHNILTRLPVKSLLRFRSVCRSWLTLIDSPNFVNSHVTTKSNTCIVTMDTTFHAYTLDCKLVDTKTAVDFNQLPDGCGEIVDSVNGIICLTNDVNVILWNPSTRKKLVLPPVSSDSSTRHGQSSTPPTIGFGYDTIGNDFKVIRLIQTWKRLGGNSNVVLDWDVQVFSLKSMAWKQVKGFPHPLRYDRERVQFAHGALHWFLTPATSPMQSLDFEDHFIVAFNLHNEDYRLFSQPKYPSRVSNMGLFTFEDNLGLVCDYMLSYIDIWVMKEYGVNDSWTRLISFDQRAFIRPVCFSRNGKQVLLEKSWESLDWYDIKEKKVKKSGIRAKPKFISGSFLYVESLVQLPGPRQVGMKDQKKITKTTTKKRDDFLSKGFKLVL